jgi:hypothetical protein
MLEDEWLSSNTGEALLWVISGNAQKVQLRGANGAQSVLRVAHQPF